MDRADSAAVDPLELQGKIAELISEARFIEVRKKGVEPALAFKELFPHLMDLVADSEKALQALEEWTAATADGESNERFAHSQLEELGNLSFLVSAELRGCRDRFERMSSESGTFSIFTVIEQVESKLLRGLCAVETELARILGLSPKSRYVDLCRAPLAVRRIIGKFRRRLAATGQQTAEQRLRSVGASLAWLRGQDDFSRIRGSDRLMASDLQKRIVDWLRSPSRPAAESRYILEEVAAFVTLADLVNRRQELVEHDRDLVAQLIRELNDAAPHDPVPDGLAQPFHKLLGRDDRLDEMLASGSDTASVLQRLIDLQEELRGTDAVAPSAVFSGSGTNHAEHPSWPPPA